MPDRGFGYPPSAGGGPPGSVDVKEVEVNLSEQEFARPISDIATTGWTVLPLWEKLDEVTPDESTTEITGDISAASRTFEVELANINGRRTKSHFLYVRMKAGAPFGGFSIGAYDATIFLMQGATVIAQRSFRVYGATYETFTLRLTPQQIDAITDYNDLRARVTAVSTGATTLSALVTWIAFELSYPARYAGEFTIIDAAITPANQVPVWIAPGPYTGKGTLADEAQWYPGITFTGTPGAGSMLTRWSAPRGALAGGNMKVYYLIG